MCFTTLTFQQIKLVKKNSYYGSFNLYLNQCDLLFPFPPFLCKIRCGFQLIVLSNYARILCGYFFPIITDHMTHQSFVKWEALFNQKFNINGEKGVALDHYALKTVCILYHKRYKVFQTTKARQSKHRQHSSIVIVQTDLYPDIYQ